jgi:hypothetical protein
MRNEKGQFVDGEAGKSTRFTRERSLGNQHAKGNPPNATTWKEGDTAGEKHPQWKGGVQNNTNDCAYVHTGVNARIRRPRKVWEDVYGELPAGYVIWHIDGDKHNDDIDNLEAITRAEMMLRNSRHSI